MSAAASKRGEVAQFVDVFRSERRHQVCLCKKGARKNPGAKAAQSNSTILIVLVVFVVLLVLVVLLVFVVLLILVILVLLVVLIILVVLRRHDSPSTAPARPRQLSGCASCRE